ncbi:MAG: ATP-binding protein [Candidatus Aenigmarchaeota archaeon]|nr:ATP-binding protein [Candidatus Aenigmarchaeota archaeon]
MEYYPRKIEEKLNRWLKKIEFIIIKGPRQSGKTTLLKHLSEKYRGIYLTFEDFKLLEDFQRNPELFIKRFIDKKYVFLDEAQYCKDIGKKLKLIFDLYAEKIKIVVTGSGSFDVKVPIGKYLVGRCVYFELFPLDFEEFLLWKAKDLYKILLEYKTSVLKFLEEGKPEIQEPVFVSEFKELLNEFLIYGGFPGIVKEDDEEDKKILLKNLVSTYLEKDIFFFFNVFHLENFRKLIKYLAFEISARLNLNSISQTLKISFKTLQKYISILQNSYLIFLVPPFFKNLSTELRKTKKIYFVDLGLRNSLLNNFETIDKRLDIGQIYENFVFNEIRELGEVKYWRTTGKAEVDFVIQKGRDIFPVEVKVRGKVGRGFLSFLEVYQPKRAIVLTEKEFGIKKIKKTEVAFIPHYFI